MQTTYTGLLRIEGAAVLGFIALVFIGALRGDLPGLWAPLPIGATLISFALALSFAIPERTPVIIAAPQGLAAGLTIGLLHATAPFVLMVPVMMAMLTLELPDAYAMAASGTVFALSAGLWGLGLTLSLWARPDQDDPENWPHEGFDFREALECQAPSCLGKSKS